MPDSKLGIIDLWLDVESIAFVSIVKFLQQALVRALREATLLIQQVKYAQFLSIDIGLHVQVT